MEMTTVKNFMEKAYQKATLLLAHRFQDYIWVQIGEHF